MQCDYGNSVHFMGRIGAFTCRLPWTILWCCRKWFGKEQSTIIDLDARYSSTKKAQSNSITWCNFWLVFHCRRAFFMPTYRLDNSIGMIILWWIVVIPILVFAAVYCNALLLCSSWSISRVCFFSQSWMLGQEGKIPPWNPGGYALYPAQAGYHPLAHNWLWGVSQYRLKEKAYSIQSNKN